MAELSNGGNGHCAVTSPSRTAPSTSASAISPEGSGRTPLARQPRAKRGDPAAASAAGPEVIQVVAEPGHELRRDIRALASELDHSLQVVEFLARVVAPTAEQDPAHTAAVGRIHRGQHPQRVGDLDLAAPARRGLAQDAEDRRVADVTADDNPR